jgi:hypothetical protein
MPMAVSLWAFIVPILVITITKMVFNWNADFVSAHSYTIGTIGQFLMDLPAVILFTRMRDRPGNITGGRSKTRDRVISITVGIVCAMLLAAMRILTIGHLMGGKFMGGVPAFTQSVDLRSPWNIFAASMALFAYGPGEAIFVIYLILAFDNALGNPQSLISWGVILTSIVWSLPHIFNVFFFGVSAITNVVVMFFVGIVMGILMKKTRSSLGSMIFWTLVNGTSL